MSEAMKSWKAEVVADSSGEFCGNGLRFATKREAEVYVDDLMMRWTAVRDTRVVESDDPVTHQMKVVGTTTDGANMWSAPERLESTDA